MPSLKKKTSKGAASNPNKVAAAGSMSDTIAAIGERIRELRRRQNMTAAELGKRTKLSTSMISLVERGLSSPSIGSLILIANALGATMSDIVELAPQAEDDTVVRSADLPVVEASNKLLRRILRQDRQHGVLISLSDYRPDTGSSPELMGHDGHEHGFLLSGQLTVEFEHATYVLKAGDLISYRSSRPHRIWNYGKKTARALWFNIHKRQK